MLEDAFTLPSSNGVTKVAKRFSRGAESQVTTTTGFIQAVAPLICRDPLVVVLSKAAAISIKLGPSSDSNNPQEIILLLTPEERGTATATKALEGFRSQVVGCSFNVIGPASKSSMTAVSTPVGHKRQSGSRQTISSSNVKQNRTKSPSRSDLIKSSVLTSVNHVVSLLLTRMLLEC